MVPPLGLTRALMSPWMSGLMTSAVPPAGASASGAGVPSLIRLVAAPPVCSAARVVLVRCHRAVGRGGAGQVVAVPYSVTSSNISWRESSLSAAI